MFEITDERRDELVELWARKIVDRGIAGPAIFMLEAHKPLAGIGANVAVAFQPLLAPLVSFNLHEVAAFMHQRDNVELLEQRIEALEEERRARLQARQRRRREARRRARRIRALRRRRDRGTAG